MKKIVFAIITLMSILVCNAVTEVKDTYAFKMSLRVPRIYNNTQSLGYRKYQTQTISGELIVTYKDDEELPVIEVTNLVNKTHKISDKNITYSCNVDNSFIIPRWNVIGNNKTDTFNIASVCFYLDAEPSYNRGEDDPDNSLLVTVSGEGSTKIKTNPYCKSKYKLVTYVKGYVSGTLGCGCTAYNHISPTRVMGAYSHTDIVDDVASVYGRWFAKWQSRVQSNK